MAAITAMRHRLNNPDRADGRGPDAQARDKKRQAKKKKPPQGAASNGGRAPGGKAKNAASAKSPAA